MVVMEEFQITTRYKGYTLDTGTGYYNYITTVRHPDINEGFPIYLELHDSINEASKNHEKWYKYLSTNPTWFFDIRINEVLE